ncbi:MAG: rhodanese-like domain-containing protein [Pirellulaceae bacterium]
MFRLCRRAPLRQILLHGYKFQFRKKPVAVYCESGYRASLAMSILKTRSIDVHSVPGSWQAWLNAGYPVEKSPE